MVYYQLWRHENYQHAMRYYECSSCLQNNYIDQRICWKYQLVPGVDLVSLRIPTKDESGNWVLETRELDFDDLLETLVEMEEYEPSIPTFEVLINKMLCDKSGAQVEICPVGMFDEELWDVIVMESLCETYSMAPCWPPVLEEQPSVLMEMFSVIRAAKNQYEAVKLERAKRSKA